MLNWLQKKAFLCRKVSFQFCHRSHNVGRSWFAIVSVVCVMIITNYDVFVVSVRARLTTVVDIVIFIGPLLLASLWSLSRLS